MIQNDGRALSATQIEAIEKRFYQGTFSDDDLRRLFDTIRVLRRVVKELLNLFQREPLRRVSYADPVPNSQLAHFEELSSVERPRVLW